MGKLSNEDIKTIMNRLNGEWPEMRIRDVAFGILATYLEDTQLASKVVYGKEDECKQFSGGYRFKHLQDLLRSYGITAVSLVSDAGNITKEENRAELIKMLDEIDDQMQQGLISPKDALSLKKDIRVKLQDKFEIEAIAQAQRIIIVPQKRDLICPHTQMECTQWPSKEACIEHYGLLELANAKE